MRFAICETNPEHTARFIWSRRSIWRQIDVSSSCTSFVFLAEISFQGRQPSRRQHNRRLHTSNSWAISAFLYWNNLYYIVQSLDHAIPLLLKTITINLIEISKILFIVRHEKVVQ